MSQADKPFHERADEYWSWFAVGLFLLVTVDLVTSMGAAVKYGLSAEANPLMRRLLASGPFAIAVAHLGVTVVAVYAFSGVMDAVRFAPDRYRRALEVAVEVWLGAIVAAGLFLFANNFSVVVLGESLL